MRQLVLSLLLMCFLVLPAYGNGVAPKAEVPVELTPVILETSTPQVYSHAEEAESNEKPSHKILGISYTPYGALTLGRISGDAQWTTGFMMGAEMDAGGAYVGLSYHLRDILTNDRDEVLPFDGEFLLSLGVYF